MIKYLSERIRKPTSEQEIRIVQALSKFCNPLTYYIVCFDCKRAAPMVNKNFYPNSCPLCETPFETLGQYCLPDVILSLPENKNAVIFVNGGVHLKRNVKAKDKYQMLMLKRMGFKIFVITNEEVDILRNMNLAATMKGILDATHDDQLYDLYMKDEKEIYGLAWH